MRPPMQAAGLQQNEASNRQQQQTTTNAQLQQASILPVDLQATQARKAKLKQQRDILAEHHLSFVGTPAPAIATAATTAKATNQTTFKQQAEDNSSSIQLVDLSTSPPTPVLAFPQVRQHQHHQPRFLAPKRASLISDSAYSRSSSSEDGSLSSGTDKLFHYSRANSFDDAAENFIINFPADSPSHNQNDCIINLPLSETEPLLTNIEATVKDSQRSICLNKNSASLIFTKKDLPPSNGSKYSNNNFAPKPWRQHSLRGFNEPIATKQTSKHLPATYHHQQRRSLQLNYNNNLVTTSTCTANNNHCCSEGVSNSKGGAALHKHHSGRTSPTGANTTAAVTRKQHAYSWYAPVYSALEEELEQDSRDSSPIHNLANTKKHHHPANYQQRALRTTHAGADNETVALLETRNQINIQAQLHVQSPARRPNHIAAPNSLPLPLPHVHNVVNTANSAVGGAAVVNSVDFSSAVAPLNSYDAEGPLAGSLGLAGGPLPRRRRWETFIKSLVGLIPTSGRSSNTSNGAGNETTANGPPSPPPQMPASPEITITRTPSEQNMVVMRHPSGRCSEPNCRSTDKLAPMPIQQGSTSSLNVVQQKLWNMMRREGSSGSLYQDKSNSVVQYKGLRKCETVLALTRQTNSLCSPVLGAGPGIVGGSSTAPQHMGSGIFSASGVEQIRPLNRLRNSMISVNATCSRCSSLLSLAASGSRYSLNVAANGGVGGFVPSSASNHQLQAPTLPHVSLQTRHSSLSCSNGRRRYDDQTDSMNVMLATRSSSLSCSRKSSAGANSTHSTSSISPPSNMTTATLNSSITASSSSPPSTPAVAPTASHENATPHISIDANTGMLIDVPSADPAAPCNPLTVTSLLSMPNVEARDMIDAAAKSPATNAVPVKSTSSTATDVVQSQPQPHQTSPTPNQQPAVPFQTFTCKLCLVDVEGANEATTLLQCGCQFCTECMKAYVEFEISEAAYEISCPDAQCPAQGIITLPEIAALTTANLMKKHHRYRLNREIELDKTRTWCPRAGCETVCHVGPAAPHSDTAPSTSNTSQSLNLHTLSPTGECLSLTPMLCAVKCPSCNDEFCAACKKTWHPNITCEEHSRRLVADGQDDIGIPFDNDLIKCCPMCAVPIEKDEGCAQMMCKRCKHVFCWYCLASLDDDFLLRHYDKGPCKNKLGHSRASVVWHRAQVIGIFAGFGILLLVASPLLLLAAPCIICCKCHGCTSSKIDEGDGDLDEATALQSS